MGKLNLKEAAKVLVGDSIVEALRGFWVVWRRR